MSVKLNYQDEAQAKGQGEVLKQSGVSQVTDVPASVKLSPTSTPSIGQGVAAQPNKAQNSINA